MICYLTGSTIYRDGRVAGTDVTGKGEAKGVDDTRLPHYEGGRRCVETVHTIARVTQKNVNANPRRLVLLVERARQRAKHRPGGNRRGGSPRLGRPIRRPGPTALAICLSGSVLGSPKLARRRG